MTDAELVWIIGPLARRLLGEPNMRLSNGRELRFGSHGSLSVDLNKGVWHDHEAGIGGGVLDLVERETSVRGPERFRWLEKNGFLSPSPKSNGAGRIVRRVRLC